MANIFQDTCSNDASTRLYACVEPRTRFLRGDGRLIGIRCVIKVEPLEPDLLRENFISDPSFPSQLREYGATKSIAFSLLRCRGAKFGASFGV